MTIRTISQLPAQTSYLPDGSLVEVSVPGQNSKYMSKRITSELLLEQFETQISSDIANKFGLLSGTIPYKVDDMSKAITQLSSGSCVLKGLKDYKTIPVISEGLSAYNVFQQGADTTYSQDYFVTNVMKVKDLINDKSCFVGADYLVDGDPGGDESPRFTVKNENFIYFRIDDNGNDSSKWIDPSTKLEAGYVECPQTGFLTMFGWLADNGNVLAQDAWIGLYAQMYVETGDGTLVQKWIPLQIQPWIIGSKSSARQYASFNMPVKAGLRLKVKTGFNVNGSTAGMQDSSTKSFSLNEPNCFVGWISHAQ